MTLGSLRRAAGLAANLLAFGAVAQSGQLPLPVLGLYAVAFALAAAREGLLARRGPVLLAATFSVLALLAAGWAFGAFDLVVAGASFTVAVAANRLLARQAPRDEALFHLTGLLMLAGGAALSGDLTYGGFFAAYSVAATFALTLSHLDRVAVESNAPEARVRELVSRRLVLALGALSVFALVGSLTLFFVFPRFTTGFLGRALGSRRAVAGFSDTIRLGGVGTLKSDPRVVARVRVDPDPLVERLDVHWRGQALDVFDGQSWTTSGGPRLNPTGRLSLVRPRPAQGSSWKAEWVPEGGPPVVFVPEAAAELSTPTRVPPRRLAPSLFFDPDVHGNVLLTPPPEMGYAYDLFLAGPRSARVGLGGEYPPDVRARHLQLPGSFDPRLRALAERWTAGATDPLEKARAIERRLLADYAYTTELPGEQDDPLAHFLLVRKAGHCEYFATAMTVLLRAVGVPARNATGYFGGQRVGPGEYVLRAGDAHAWTEVFFPGVGFVTFDATPADDRASSAADWQQRWADFVYRSQNAWLRLVIDYSFRDQLEGASGFGRAVARLYSAAQDRGALPILAGVLLSSGALVALLRRLGRLRLRRVAVPPEAREAVLLYRELLRRLGKRGLEKAPGQTPREFVAALRRAGRPEEAVAAEVTERYLCARFGGEPLTPSDRRQLLQSVRTL